MSTTAHPARHDANPGRPRHTIRRLAPVSLAALTALGVGGVYTPAIAAPVHTATSQRDHVAYPPHSHPRGASLTTWTQRWWSWALGQPLAHNPNIGAITRSCARGQHGNVWYLPQTLTGGAVRACAVPRGTATVVNMVGVLADYPCPDPSYHPAPGQSLHAFLRKEAVQALGTGTLRVRLDGRTVPGLMRYRYVTPMYKITEDPSMVAIDSCDTGKPQHAVAAGYTLMLRPLPPGLHTLKVYAKASDDADHLSVTYVIDVRR